MIYETAIANDPAVDSAPLERLSGFLTIWANGLEFDWDECYFRQAHANPSQTEWQQCYRKGRALSFFRASTTQVAEMQALLGDVFAQLFARIESVKGKQPKVGLLCVSRDGKCNFLYDLERPENLQISLHLLGRKGSYFKREEIDPPEVMVQRIDEGLRWEQLLDGKPVLEVIFPLSRLGLPYLDDTMVFENIVQDEMTNCDLGKVVGGWGRDDEMATNIGVVDLQVGVEKITSILKRVKAPMGTTLRQIEPEVKDFPLDLMDKSEFFQRESNTLINDLISESIKCSPASWTNGALTINFDGSYVTYKLKNANSPDKALISDELKKMCEEFCVLMWSNGQRWIESELAYARIGGSVDFKVNFKYDGATKDEPPAKRSRWGFLQGLFGS